MQLFFLPDVRHAKNCTQLPFAEQVRENWHIFPSFSLEEFFAESLIKWPASRTCKKSHTVYMAAEAECTDL